jgi:uncharacterized protein YccT (UPF0319 family)
LRVTLTPKPDLNAELCFIESGGDNLVATFSSELADRTIAAPSIESWRNAQHAALRATRRHLIDGPKEGDSR